METENLENRLNEIRDILIELESLKTEIRFISNKEEDYFQYAVEQSSFFYRVYRNSIRLFVIDICKLLIPDEHFSITKTIDYALSNRKRINWYREIKIDRLKILKEKVEKLNLEQLKNFEILRNKYYAHNDKNKYDFESKVTLSNCWESLETIQGIFNELSLGLQNKEFRFETFGKEPQEIISISRYRQIKEYVLSELRKSPHIGKLQEVRDITLGKKVSK